MNKQNRFFDSAMPITLSALRFITGFLFIGHGMQKLFNFPAWEHGAAPLMSFMGFTGALELVGGAFILIGLFTRPTAFILSGMMAVAYFMVHASSGFLPIANKGELAVLFSFVFLFFSVAGGGPISVDALLRRPVSKALEPSAAAV